MRTVFRRLTAPALAGIMVLGVWSCTSDDIPTTPPPPFLFSRIVIGRDAKPQWGTFLAKGATVTARYDVSYTLNTADARNRTTLAMLVDLYGALPGETTFVQIGPFPDKQTGLSADGGTVRDSLTFTVPNNVVAVYMQAFLDTVPIASTRVIAIDDLGWPVR